MTFDTSLFEKNDPELAREVAALGIYFDGMEEVRISWIDAKGLVNEYSKDRLEIEMFITMLENGKEQIPYYRYLQLMAIDSGEYRSFIKVIRLANKFYYEDGEESLRVVYYETDNVW